MMNLLIHSDINSLVTGSAKDYLYVSRSKVLTDFLFLIFFFFGGGGGRGGFSKKTYFTYTQLTKWANIGLPLKRRLGGRPMMARH